MLDAISLHHNYNRWLILAFPCNPLEVSLGWLDAKLALNQQRFRSNRFLVYKEWILRNLLHTDEMLPWSSSRRYWSKSQFQTTVGLSGQQDVRLTIGQQFFPELDDQRPFHYIGVPSLESFFRFGQRANNCKHVKMFIRQRTFAVLVVRYIKNMKKMILLHFNPKVFRKIDNCTWKESTTLLESSFNIFSPFRRFIRYTFDLTSRRTSNCKFCGNTTKVFFFFPSVDA